MSKQRTQNIGPGAPAQKPYDRVLIIGPGHDEKFVNQARETLDKSGLTYCIIGDGIHPIGKNEITNRLGNNITAGTEIFISAHGSVHQGAHQIKLQDKSHATSVVFKALNNCYREPGPGVKYPGLRVSLFSCFAGAAASDVVRLPKGSVATLPASRGHIAWSDMDQRAILRALASPKKHDPFVQAADYFRHSPETTTVSVHTEQGFKKCTLRTSKEVLLTPEATKRHIGSNIGRYADWVERNSDDFYNDPTRHEAALETLRQLQAPKKKEDIAYYSQYAAVVRTTHGKEEYLRKYLDGKKPNTSECNRLLRSAIGNHTHTAMPTLLLEWMKENHRNIEKDILLYAAEEGNTQAVQTLFAYGVDPNTRLSQYTGKPPLYVAVEKGHYETAKALLEHKDIRTAEPCHKTGETPLHRAVINGNGRIVALLLEHDANSKNKDHEGLTPIDYAKQNGQDTILKQLEAAEKERKASRPPHRQLFGCLPLPFREKQSFVEREETRKRVREAVQQFIVVN